MENSLVPSTSCHHSLILSWNFGLWELEASKKKCVVLSAIFDVHINTDGLVIRSISWEYWCFHVDIFSHNFHELEIYPILMQFFELHPFYFSRCNSHRWFLDLRVGYVSSYTTFFLERDLIRLMSPHKIHGNLSNNGWICLMEFKNLALSLCMMGS